MRSTDPNRVAQTIGALGAGVAIVLLAGCATVGDPAAAGGTAAETPRAEAPAAGHDANAGHQPGTAGTAQTRANPADVRFMSMMIGHHAQAIEMSRLVPTHSTNPSIQILAGRIINAQEDEIRLIQMWLRDHGQPAPDPKAAMTEAMSGQHAMHMAGMLTEAQMKELADARGEDFDRLFLRYMIEHHKGAVTMVDELFASYGAAQDDTVFKLASDISAEQTSEIARMQKMLFDLMFAKDPQ